MRHTLDSVVKEHLVDIGDVTEKTYFTVLVRAIACLRELSQDTDNDSRVVELDVEDNGTVNLPDDYMDYIFIGVSINGRLYNLGKNDAINPILLKDACGDEQIDVNIEDGVIPTFINVSRTPGGLFGIGGGSNSNGYYKIDEANGRIILNLGNATVSSIILVYTYDPSLMTGKHYVHSYDVEAVKAYLVWKNFVMSRNRGVGEKQLAEKTWFNQKRMARARHKSFTLNEAYQSTRKSYKQTPKS